MSEKRSTFVPNSFQTPNGYVDDLLPFLTGEEYKVLIYATRRILGFQKRQDRISLSQFTDGTMSRDGRRLDYGTGLAKATVTNCLANLVEFGLMVKEADNDPKTNEGTLWGLQWDASLINWKAIEAHLERRSKINAARIARARSVRQDGSCRTDRGGVSGTDLARVSGTDRGGDSGTGTQNPGLNPDLKTDEKDLKNLFFKASEIVFSDVLELRTLETVIAELGLCDFLRDDHSLIVSGLPGDRPAYYTDRYKSSFERAFVGILGEEVSIDFTGSGDVSAN